MKFLAINILWIVSFILPYLVFVIKNEFKNNWIIFIRAIIAIIIGWIYVIAYTIAANSISFVEQYIQGNNSIEELGGATFAFVSIFGWITPTIVVFTTCLFIKIVIPYMNKKKNNG